MESRFLFFQPLELRAVLQAPGCKALDFARARREANRDAMATLGQLLSHYSTNFRIYSYRVSGAELGFAFPLDAFDPSFDLGATLPVRYVESDPVQHMPLDERVRWSVYLGSR